ncbi:hypothetical protein Tco_0604349 [Tanacetum coccineum]
MNRHTSKKTSTIGYQKIPTLSSNNYKKNAGVGGSGRFGGSSGLSSNTYKQKTSVGASNSARYGGSSSLSTNGYKGRSSSYGGSKIVGSVGGSREVKMTNNNELQNAKEVIDDLNRKVVRLRSTVDAKNVEL